MVALSARFAALTSLCAVVAVAIPPRAEAAHIHAGHSMEKYTSSPHAQRRKYSASFFDRLVATHEHHDKNGGQPHESPSLPPLLRRHRVSDQNHKGKDRHDAGHKVPRSTFARSRYRGGRAQLGRRSSVYVPDEHGNTYLVSGAHADGRTSYTLDRREVDESDLALGRIDIMSTSQRLASLTVDSTPIDWKSGPTTTKAFQLSASTTNQTQFIMVPMDSDQHKSFTKHVTLATEVFDAGTAEMVMYCATYDSDPGATSALLMTPCTTASTSVSNAVADPCSGDEDDALPPSPHESQIFSYDPSTGKIEPISIATHSLSTRDSDPDDSNSCAASKLRRRDNASSSTASSSAAPSSSASTSTSTSTLPKASPLQQARNVTLVYVAGALEVPASSPKPSTSTNTNTASSSPVPVPVPVPVHPVPVVTTTITTTILQTVTTSGSASPGRTVAPARAAVSTPPGSSVVPTPSASGGTPVPSPPQKASGSVPAPGASKVPADPNESFEVDIVGITPSATSTGSLSTTSHSSTSGTPRPQAAVPSLAGH